MSKFNVGDEVVFQGDDYATYCKNWDVSIGERYTVLKVEKDVELITILNDVGVAEKFHTDFFKPPTSLNLAVPTSWKVGDTYFSLELEGDVSIFGNGEITISIEQLKVILDTVRV